MYESIQNLPSHRAALAPRAFVSLAIVSLAFLARPATAPALPGHDHAKPNIVFIMADDMGIGDPGCYNADSKVPTPNMDRLAAAGIRFTDAHSPSAVCTPTRYGVLTGRYSWRTRMKSGVLWGYSRSLIEPGRLTVASLLKKHGYRTACVGKWHLGLQEFDPSQPDAKVDYEKPLTPGPNSYGFDYFYGIPASLDMEPYVFVQDDRPTELPTAMVEASRHRRQNGGGFWRGGPIAPSFKHIDVLPRTTEQAVGFIDGHALKHHDKPFFLYFPLSAPHTPWLPTGEWSGKTSVGYYGDFTAQVDWTIGQIMAALDRNGMTKNTLIIVTSDNGSHWPDGDIPKWNHDANHGYRGQKADAWEGGHRVPFIARWPEHIKPGSVSTQTICLTDLIATSAAIIGAELPADAGEDSYNILPALLSADGGKPIREATVHHSANGTFAIRQGDWKLIEGNLGSGGFTNPRVVKPNADGPQGQLYNLKKDRAETNNVWEAHPDVVERLTKLLEKYRESGRSAP